MGKALIGVTPLWDEDKNSIWMLPGYLNCLEKAGALPIILPLSADPELILQTAKQVDGFLFTGGQDVDPRLYDQEPTPLCGPPSLERDAMESLLFREAVLGRNKPALGICRGLQLFNALLGGELYQDLPSQTQTALPHRQNPPYDQPAHEVRILPGTRLAALLDRESLMVNSAHHQGVKTLAPRLQAMAVAPDGLLEAACLPDQRFAWAVQWHPEMAPDSRYSRLLFAAFAQACAQA